LSLFPAAGKVTKRAAAADKLLKINLQLCSKKRTRPQESGSDNFSFKNILPAVPAQIDFLNTISQRRNCTTPKEFNTLFKVVDRYKCQQHWYKN
jgi:hypothetical protein